MRAIRSSLNWTLPVAVRSLGMGCSLTSSTLIRVIMASSSLSMLLSAESAFSRGALASACPAELVAVVELLAPLPHPAIQKAKAIKGKDVTAFFRFIFITG